MLRVFFGQHKCASQWVILVLERIANELGWKSVYAHRALIMKHGGVQELINAEQPDLLFIAEAEIEKLLAIKVPFKGFHISRDPRDLIVSGYFSHRDSHPISWSLTQAYREQLKRLPKQEGIDLEIEKLGGSFVSHMYHWDYAHPDILEARFDRFTEDPRQGFEQALKHLDMFQEVDRRSSSVTYLYNRLLKKAGLHAGCIKLRRYSANQLEQTLEEISFNNLQTGQLKRFRQKPAHYRRGRSGNWRAHLTEAQAQRILDRFPGILAKLGLDEEVPVPGPAVKP